MKKLFSVGAGSLAVICSLLTHSDLRAEEVPDASCNTISDQSSKDAAGNQTKDTEGEESKDNARKAK
jgi:hypothetical protein